MWAVFITVIEVFSVLAESFLAFLAGKYLSHVRRGVEEGQRPRYHFVFLEEWVTFGFCMAFGTIEPFSTWNVLALGYLHKGGEFSQHGDLIETCALRMCLLQVLLMLVSNNTIE
jgi:hypothetical protein